jgi:subtilase family serine protease
MSAWQPLSRVPTLLAAFTLGATALASPASSSTVAPRPFIDTRLLGSALATPPDTALCQQLLGIACYRPDQIQNAYHVNSLLSDHLNGAGRTIVIVNPFGSPTIEQDLHVFDQTFGLPDPPSFQVIQPVGAVPPFDPNGFGGDQLVWAEETSLDVEWAHVTAPAANILLVETPTDETEGIQGFPQLVAAENFVIDHNLGDVISQSFGATEQTFPNASTIRSLRGAFISAREHHVTVLAAAGDTGATGPLPDQSCCFKVRATTWPATDPLVTAVGGTQLHLDLHGNRLAPDNVWNDNCDTSTSACLGATGGGTSTVFARPEFQDRVGSVVGRARGMPDLSLSAAKNGAVVIHFTFVRPESPWHLAGGTSVASPLFAGVVAIADQLAGRRLGWLNPRLYRLNSGIVDITQGDNAFTFCASEPSTCGTPSEVDTTVPGFAARPGYDLASGLGTIDANQLVRALAEHHTEDEQGDDRGDN